MGSTRLPGKVLMKVLDNPMLWHVVCRTRLARRVDEVVVATTTTDADQAIVSLCESEGWLYFRGSEDDVLDRYYRAALYHRADVAVRITSDCPLIDPEVIDRVIKEFVDGQPELDYVSNTLQPRTFPRGLDVEVLSFNALEHAWKEDSIPEWREHVTPYIYRNPHQFMLQNVTNNADYSYLRCTVDTKEDLAFVRQIFEYFGCSSFSWHDVVAIVNRHPEWLTINNHIVQKLVP